MFGLLHKALAFFVGDYFFKNLPRIQETLGSNVLPSPEKTKIRPGMRLPFHRASLVFALSLLFFTVMISACGSSARVRYDSPQDAFEKGKENYDNEKYEKAILFFQGAFDFGRAHEWAADAQLFLARAYRGNKEYLLAANEFARFSQIYRSDPRVADAEYELALTYFDRSPDYSFDQTDTERAIEQFRLFISRYGNHQLVIQAQQQIGELREKLARKQLEISQMYERIRSYQAAALSYESLFDDYYDSTLADDALLGAMRNYLGFAINSVASRQVERLEQVIKNYDRLIQIFPDSPLLKDAEAFRERATRLLESVQVNS